MKNYRIQKIENSNLLFLFVLVFVSLTLVSLQPNAVGAASSSDANFAYVRIFTAKVPDGLNMSLNELETIARDRGTEETLMFSQSDGPEAGVERKIIRLGSQENSYPGFTLKARTHFANREKAGAFKISKDGKTTSEQLGNTILEWTLPEAIASPLECKIKQNDEVITTNTIHEKFDPSGKKRWPKIIRVDLPKKGGSIVQVFEYLSIAPEQIQRAQSEPNLSAGLNSSILTTEGTAISGLALAAPPESDSVSFAASLTGLSYSWNSGWQPGGRQTPGGFPLQLYIGAGVGFDISSSVSGNFILTRNTSSNGNLQAGSAQGSLTIDAGAEASFKGSVDIWIVDPFVFNIPYTPNFDLRCYDKEPFYSYLLDSSVTASDSTDKQTFFSVPLSVLVGIPPIVSGGVSAQAATSLTGTMTADSISTSDGKLFTQEGQSLSTSLVNGGYSSTAYYNESLRVTDTVTFYPSFYIDIYIYRWDWPVVGIPWNVISSAPINLNFSNSSLYFPTVSNPSISGYVRTSGGAAISGVTITFSNSGGSATTDGSGYYSKQVSYGWSGTATPSKTGYIFSPTNRNYSGVFSNQSSQGYTGTPQTYTLTVNSSGASGVSISSSTGHGGTTNYARTVTSGTSVNLQAPQYVGSCASRTRFNGWTGSVTSSNQSITFTMDGNKTVTANYVADPETYTLTVNSSGASSVSISSSTGHGGTTNYTKTVTCGTSVTLTAPLTASGQTFTGWTGDVPSNSQTISFSMNGPKTVTANFAINTYTLTITATNGSVSKTPNKSSYSAGETVTLQATPNTGYHFVNWSGDASGTSDSVQITMNSNKSVTANFAINTYTLNITATNGSVTKTPNKTFYNYGETVTLVATANTGYHFSSWSGDASGTNSTTSIVMNINKSVTANFSLNIYSLNVISSNGSVTKTPDKTSYNHGETVTLEAVSNSGYHFVSWSGDLSGSSNPETIVMDSAKTVTANYVSDTESVLRPMTVDLNNDGIPDFYDFSYFAMFWQNASCSPPNWCEGRDFNHDGVVDVKDLQIFVKFWLWPVADVDMDGDVDSVDYAALANQWMAENCAEPDWCGGADINKSGKVDCEDLDVFTRHWLEGTTP
jgi:hypothetical protein